MHIGGNNKGEFVTRGARTANLKYRGSQHHRCREHYGRQFEASPQLISHRSSPLN
jgi:hypothetical protein